MMMMNCLCGMVDRRKAFSLISSRDHCQRSSPSWISDTPRAGFEPAQKPKFGLCWMKLCSNANHYTTAPLNMTNEWPLFWLDHSVSNRSRQQSCSIKKVHLTLFRMEVPLTSTNLKISLQNFLTFSFNPFPHWCKISRSYLVPVSN